MRVAPISLYLAASVAVASCGLWIAPALSAPTVAHYEVVVSAPDRDYTEAPVWVEVKAPAGAAWAHMPRESTADGPPAPCQLVRYGDVAGVVFLVRDMRRGETRRYSLDLYDKAQLKAPGEIEIKADGDAVAVTIDGELFTRYNFLDTPKPFYWPVIGPGGIEMTRNYPMKQVAGESSDHVHHRSLWFTHGSVNGVDFWGESQESGRIVHRDFEAQISGPVVGVIRTRDDWIARDGKKVCEDEREVRVYRVADGRLFDYQVVVHASEGPVKFGDTKEGTFGIRLADSMAVIRGKGHIVNSAGDKDRDTWGKRAEWVDYSGPVGDKVVGVTIFDHPESFRHPTYWHVRDYGLFAANPFGIRDFTGLPDGEPGAYTIEKGQSLTFRYRIYVHDGWPDVAALSTLYDQYAHPPQVAVR
jgi:hypothetical protein